MRLFVAVLLASDTRNALCALQNALRNATVQGRFSRPENLHLTLAFLGELPKTSVPAARSCLDTAVSGIAPFSLAFTQLDRFRRRDGDLYYAGFSCPPQLLQLRQQLVGALDHAGLPYDPKPLRPHLTLARDVVLAREAQAPLPPGPIPDLTVSSIALMESARIQGVLTYTPLYRAALSS